MLCMDDTLDEEDVWIIFDALELQNSPLQISLSWRLLFLKILLSTNVRQRVFRLRYMSRNIAHAYNDQANKLVFVFVLGS